MTISTAKIGRWPVAALFDLDGTLIDSIPDITVAAGELLASEGLPPPTEDAVRRMVGRGVSTLVERAFSAAGEPLSAERHTEMLQRMMEIYPRHLVGKTVLMPGTLAALDWLEGIGARLAVVTNKPQAFTDTILEHFGLLDRFQLVLGDDPLAEGGNLPRKPAPDMLLFALHKLEALATGAIMVGDSEADIRAGKAAAVYAVGVRGGYSASPLETFAPDLVLDSLADLPRSLPAGRPHLGA